MECINSLESINLLTDMAYKAGKQGIGLYETVGEPPSCKKWSYIILGEDGRSSVYRPDVRPNGFCAWAERIDDDM